MSRARLTSERAEPYRYVYQRPSGARIEVRGMYKTVDPPHHLVHTETYDFSPIKLLVTITLEQADAETVFNQRIEYSTKQERDDDFDSVATSAREAYAALQRYLDSSR